MINIIGSKDYLEVTSDKLKRLEEGVNNYSIMNKKEKRKYSKIDIAKLIVDKKLTFEKAQINNDQDTDSEKSIKNIKDKRNNLIKRKR